MSTRVVSSLLFVSGVCALVFQTAWLRDFRLIFGASTPASAAVMAIFMAGLGLGNVVLGRRVDQAANPLKLYAQFELAVSIFSMLSPLMVQLVRAVYLALGGQETLGVFGATGLRLLLSAIVIGPPTFFMGGTLPAAARSATGDRDDSRGDVGWLYGMNTLGAVAGTLISTFFLLERLGNRETLWLAGAINLINAVVALSLAPGWQEHSTAVEPHGESLPAKAPLGKRKAAGKQRERSPAETSPASSLHERQPVSPALVYAAAAMVGGVFFLMELVWYRMLAAILGGTTFTFGLILAVALTGIGLGGAIYPALFRRRVPSVRDFALTCGWEALAIAIPFALGDRLALFAGVLQGMRYFGFAGQAIGWAIVAAIVILPAAIASGVQFPLLIALLGQGHRDVGRQVGRALGWNSVGSILGSLAGGFGLLPLLTAPGVWKAAAVALIILALAALWLAYRGDKRASPLLNPLLTTASAALCLTAIGPTAVWRHSAIGAGRARPPAAMNASYNDLRSWMNDRRRLIAWEADGTEASVAIATGGSVAFLVNGKSDGNSVTDAATQIMFPVLGAMLHAEPRDCMVIGLGTGESAGWLAALPTVERVDVVELEPAIAHVAELCAPLNHDVLHHPKVHLTFNDARELLQTTRRQYDLIASEPSNPYRAGVSSLYTLDFYEHARRRLKPGGLFVQWLQGYEIDVPTVRMVLATLHRIYPYIEIWETKPGDMMLVCGAEALTYDLDRLRSRIGQPPYREALRLAWRTSQLEGVLAHFVANEKFVARVVAQEGIPINLDNRNLLEYRFARTVGRAADFSVAQLAEDARQQKLAWPLALRDGVDWEAVADQRVAYQVALGDPPLILPLFGGDRGKRVDALRHYFEEHLTEIVPAWEAQPKPPVDLFETTVLALGYAERGDKKASPLIKQLERSSPLDASIVLALLLQRQGKTADAAEHLAAALVKLRDDATVLPRLVDIAHALAAQIVKQDAQQGQRLFMAMSQPYALWLFNERRLLTRCLLSQQLGSGAMSLAMADMEPHVPWNEELLEMRARAYEVTGNPVAPRARRELDEYRRYAGESHVLMAR